jgi:integrase
MGFQRGSLKKVERKEGQGWVLRYRTNAADGRRVENTLPVGLVCLFPKERDAWREVDKLGLLARINNEQSGARMRFAQLAEHYLKVDFSEDAVRPKTEKTVSNVQHLVRDYLIVRFGDEIAEDIKPIEIQRYFKYLNADMGLAWPTVSKIRGIMLRIYKIGILYECVERNPVVAVETRSKTNYRAIVLSPIQTLAIIQALPNILHRMLVLTCAATALRASEVLALRWADILWEENRIRVSKRWSKGKDGPTKNSASDGFVPMHPVLAAFLEEWHTKTPYGKETNFVFPSLKAGGKVPVSPAMFVADHLRVAAKATGIAIEDGQRFGLHNLRHSLSNWLVNKAKVEPKTVQGMLRHSRIQTTMDLYTQDDSDETRAAQGKFLEALAMPTQTVQ